MFRKLALAGFALPAMMASAHAAPVPITVITTPGTTYNTAALTGFSTFSANMVGSLVTVTFAGGTTQQVAWTAAGALGTA
jgi:YD repeat-containing protein